MAAEVFLGDVEAALSHLSWSPRKERARPPQLLQWCYIFPPLGGARTAGGMVTNENTSRLQWAESTQTGVPESQWDLCPRQGGGPTGTNQQQAMRLYKSGLCLSRRHFAEAESRSWIRGGKNPWSGLSQRHRYALSRRAGGYTIRIHPHGDSP